MAERWVIDRGGEAPLVLPLTAPWGAMVIEMGTPVAAQKITWADRREGAVPVVRSAENVEIPLKVAFAPPRDSWPGETHTFPGPPVEGGGDGPVPGWTGPTRRATAGSPVRAMVEDVQAAVGRLAAQGGTLTRVFGDGTSLTYVVHSAAMPDAPSWDLAWFVAGYTTVTVSFTCAPYALGDEVQLGTKSWSSGNRMVTLTDLQVPGNVPALGRLVMTNGTWPQKSFMVGVDQPDTATQAVGAELAVVGRERPAGGTAGTVAGSASAQVLTVSGSTGSWTPHVGLRALADAARLNVRGTFRVFVRLRGGGGTSRLRLRWTSGTIESGVTTNPPAELSTTAGWVLADLGTVTIPAGGQLDGVIDRIQGAGCSYDRLILVPADVHTRGYALAGTADQVIYTAGRVLQLDHRSATRATSDGRVGQVASVVGDWLTLPPSGRARRPVRVVVAAGRDDWRTTVDSVPDDNLIVTVHARPRWLLVPGPTA